MLTGIAEFLGLDAEFSDDVKTAVSEACNNVVLHAYPHASGPLSVSLEASGDNFDVVVRDEGTGIQRIAADEDRMGVGLAVISALASRAEFESAAGEGTEVRMSFDGRGPLGSRLATLPADRTAAGPPLAGAVVVELSPPELLPIVMGRLVRAVAAGAHFSVDRFPSLHLLTTAIGARAAGDGAEPVVGFAITGTPRRLALSAGRMPAGSSAALFDGSVPPELEELIASQFAHPAGSGEIVELELVEPRA
jgi:anti-sigma regulatory factor (Ser/Thr protein kinase)